MPIFYHRERACGIRSCSSVVCSPTKIRCILSGLGLKPGVDRPRFVLGASYLKHCIAAALGVHNLNHLACAFVFANHSI